MMPTNYAIKIANTGEAFGPNQQESTRWQTVLERGHRITHGVCLCLRDDKPRYVAIKLSSKKKYYLARYGETHHHRKNCRFYALDASQSGRQGYTQEALRADEDGGLVINLARSLAAPCAVVRDSLNTQAVDRYARPGVKRNRIGLGGLLDLLWEQADLNRWDANTKKRWDLKVGKALLDQAEMIRVGRKTMLNEALLLPSVGVKDKPSARSIEHTRNLEVVQNAHQSGLRLVAVAPLANFNAEKDLLAGTDVTAAETEKVLRLGSLGIPRLMMDPACQAAILHSYARELSAWQRGAKVYAIVQMALRPRNPKLTRAADVADVFEVCLMHLSERFIPLDSSYEGKLEQALVDAKRSFVKPLRYEADDLVFPDFWLSDMGGDYPLEVFGMNTVTYLERKLQKTAIYGDATKYPLGWWYWDVLTQPMIPTLPTPVAYEPEDA
jgi:hypothetical protein